MDGDAELSEKKQREVRAAFARQGLMRTLGAELTDVGPGRCTIELAYSEALSQHHGFLHGGIVGAIGDNAGGFAAATLMPDGDVVTLEYKINFLRPAAGERLVAEGRVLRAGRQVTVTRVDLFMVQGQRRVLCAALQQSLMATPKALGGHVDAAPAGA